MIATLSEIKTLLGITASTYDNQINMLIPIIESKICNYCNNHFIDSYESRQGIMPSVFYYSNTISFAETDNSMNDSSVDFTTKNFKAGDNIRIYNSVSNSGIFTIDSIAATKIILNSINSIVDEDLGNTIVFARIKFPYELKDVVADMIKYKITKKTPGMKSERFDDYGYTRDDKLISGYPESIISGLQDYCSMYLKTIPWNILYNRQV